LKALDPTLKQIKISILKILPGSVIILFGSRARNDNFENSDYDLLVITDKQIDTKEKLKFQGLIRKQLAIRNILADVIIQSKADIAVKRKLPGHIVRSALEEGVLV